MALFGKKKEEKKDEAASEEVVKTASVKAATPMTEDLSWVLVSPRLTEKAAIATSGNVYTFNVRQDANKIQIKKAIAQMYKVMPTKVNIVVNKPEQIFARGRKGVKKGFKKAMVFLKKGDKIEFV